MATSLPKTVGGRTIAMLWMLLSMGLTAGLTAHIVNTSRMGGGTVALSKLVEGQRVGVLGGGAAEVAVRGAGGRTVPFPNLTDAVDALEEERVDRVAGAQAALNAAGAGSVRMTSVQMPMAVRGALGRRGLPDRHQCARGAAVLVGAGGKRPAGLRAPLSRRSGTPPSLRPAPAWSRSTYACRAPPHSGRPAAPRPAPPREPLSVSSVPQTTSTGIAIRSSAGRPLRHETLQQRRAAVRSIPCVFRNCTASQCGSPAPSPRRPARSRSERNRAAGRSRTIPPAPCPPGRRGGVPAPAPAAAPPSARPAKKPPRSKSVSPSSPTRNRTSSREYRADSSPDRAARRWPHAHGHRASAPESRQAASRAAWRT